MLSSYNVPMHRHGLLTAYIKSVLQITESLERDSIRNLLNKNTQFEVISKNFLL